MTISPKSWRHRVGHNELILGIFEALLSSVQPHKYDGPQVYSDEVV